ncbi:MarR family winged helix-turn-helix transcriptional regulator [Nocardia sp. BMG111209]|uniref:MarR family winged helix-turn-helix transcriptional regulator n=1 Tax=Nocardia sp. BMG111209 TaxID=1160137 RepID=UPI0003802289|nr:MarR family transcriptional regulator [Nocardia sp. BMG111209]
MTATQPVPPSSTRIAALSPDGQRWMALTLLHTEVQARIERELQRKVRITFSELAALHALSENSLGELRIQELADVTSLNQSSVSRLVSRLQETGLTERRTCEFDRRGVYTGITEKGREVLHTATGIYEHALRASIDAIPTPNSATSLRNAIAAMPVTAADETDHPTGDSRP